MSVHFARPELRKGWGKVVTHSRGKKPFRNPTCLECYDTSTCSIGAIVCVKCSIHSFQTVLLTLTTKVPTQCRKRSNWISQCSYPFHLILSPHNWLSENPNKKSSSRILNENTAVKEYGMTQALQIDIMTHLYPACNL